MSDPHPCCCVSGAHSCTGPQGTLSAGITCATIRLESASTRQTQKATAPKTACTALLLMGPMTSAPLSMTSGGLMAEGRGGGLAADAVSTTDEVQGWHSGSFLLMPSPRSLCPLLSSQGAPGNGGLAERSDHSRGQHRGPVGWGCKPCHDRKNPQ